MTTTCPHCHATVLSTSQPASEFVLMPREATRAMTMAACDSLPSCEHIFGHAGEMLRNCYRKMVEVAALAATPAVGGDPDLTDPVVVHVNMLRGTIAKPTWAQIKHLYPEQFAPPASPLRGITDEMVSLACEAYAEVYHDDDKDMGDAMRAALKAASASPPEQPAADPEMFRCNCPHEVRSGCSEPQCPHYTPPRTEQPAAARDEAFTLKGSETENLAQQLIDATKRSGVDTYTATLLWRASSLIDRLSASPPGQPAATPAVGGEPVAWRYQRKEGWDDIWRCTTIEPDFETPYDWIVQPLYAAPPASPLRGRETLETLIREYARDLRRNSSGGDDYPWEIMAGVADYLEVLIGRASPPEQPAAARPAFCGTADSECHHPACSCARWEGMPAAAPSPAALMPPRTET